MWATLFLCQIMFASFVCQTAAPIFLCGGFFSGMFQKSHPNFQDVKTSRFFLVWIFWSPKMGGFGLKPEGFASEPTPKLPKLPRFIMKRRRHARAGESQHFSSILEVIFLRNTRRYGFQESLFWVVRPPIYLHEVSTGWRQWSVRDHRKLVTKVNFILLGSFLLAFAIEEADSWDGTWDPGKYGRWKLETVFFLGNWKM